MKEFGRFLRLTNLGREQRSKPRMSTPDEFRGTDMTKVLIPDEAWVYFHVVIRTLKKDLVYPREFMFFRIRDETFALAKIIQ